MEHEVYLQKLLSTLNTEEGRNENNESYVVVKSGTFEDLTRYLVVSSPNDPSSVEAFLLTYRGFGHAPQDVFNVVTQQYKSMKRVDKLPMIADGLPVFFQIWIRLNYYSDFIKQGGLFEKTIEFFEFHAKSSDEELRISNSIKLAFIRSQSTHRGLQKTKRKKENNPGMDLALEEIPSSVVADQFTLIEWNLFQSIEVPELLNMSWQKKNKHEIAPNVVAMVERTNLVSYWLSTEICTYYNIKKRIKLVEKVINVAWKCVQLNNFATTMEIMGGLNNVAVSRLKNTWKGISERCRERWEKLTQIMDTTGNYGEYRTLLQNARAQKVPAIPFLGVFLRDLTFIEDGNENLINGEQINFEKTKLLGSLIKDFTDMQRNTYPIRKIEGIYQSLLNIAVPEGVDEAIYELSLLVEPKAVA